MCLAIPAKITHIEPTTGMAQVAIGAVSKEISLALVEGAVVGDYVLVHVGYALNKLSEEEAEYTLRLIREIGLLDDELADSEAPAVVPGQGGAR